jgi:hypothetical protein
MAGINHLKEKQEQTQLQKLWLLKKGTHYYPSFKNKIMLQKLLTPQKKPSLGR